jgi:tetratricopeptide (TPR) repeat protein
MVMIARNEEANIDRCFSSWWDAVDEAILCDTGSTDGTIAAARDYAERRGASTKLTVAHYEWADDFGAARAYADTVATGEWISWVDLDDEIRGMAYLRNCAIQARSDIDGFFVSYRCATDVHGNVLSEMRRARLARAGVGTWHNPVHEVLVLGSATIATIDSQSCEWVHHGDALVSERNLRILREWRTRDPHDMLVVANVGIELLGLGYPAEAANAFREALAIADGPADVRARTWRHLATASQSVGDVAAAKAAGVAAREEDPMSADAYLTLAECAHREGEWRCAYDHAARAMELGKPDTMLAINPSEYVLHPRMIMASAAYSLGDTEEAVRLADEALRARERKDAREH